MKQRLKLFVVFISLLFGNIAYVANSMTEWSDKAVLWGEDRLASSRTLLPIRGVQTQNTVDIEFVQPLGIVDVTMTNSSDEVLYQNTVDASLPTQLSMFIGGLEAGDYEIQLQFTGRNDIFGKFTID